MPLHTLSGHFMAFRALAVVLVLCGVFTAATDNPALAAKEITPQVSVATTVVTGKETINYKVQLDQHTKELEALKASQTALEKTQKELSAKVMPLDKADDELLAALKKQETVLNLYADRLTAVEKNLEGLKLTLETVNESVDAMKKKEETDSETLNKFTSRLDSFKLNLDIAQDDIKVKSEESKVIKDSIAMMKNNIDSNVTDNIDLKKQLREMSAKSETKVDKGILGWENWGVVAAGVGVIALIIAIAK